MFHFIIHIKILMQNPIFNDYDSLKRIFSYFKNCGTKSFHKLIIIFYISICLNILRSIWVFDSECLLDTSFKPAWRLVIHIMKWLMCKLKFPGFFTLAIRKIKVLWRMYLQESVLVSLSVFIQDMRRIE